MKMHHSSFRPSLQHALPLSFYRRSTEVVARELIGCDLVRMDGKAVLAGRIVETEAYLGREDPACHSYRGETERVAPMFRPGGVAYIYFVYGMHFCFNVVTGGRDEPEAVLIRALEPLGDEGELMKRRGGRSNLTGGPAMLCQALGIDKSFNSHPLNRKPLWIQKGETIRRDRIDASPRIGVGYAGEAASWPLRFTLRESSFLSRHSSRR